MIGLKTRIRNFATVEKEGRAYILTLEKAPKDKVWAHIPDMRVGGGAKDVSPILASSRENSILGGQADRIYKQILNMNDDVTKITAKLIIK